jgi:hypothetical protein
MLAVRDAAPRGDPAVPIADRDLDRPHPDSHAWPRGDFVALGLFVPALALALGLLIAAPPLWKFAALAGLLLFSGCVLAPAVVAGRLASRRALGPNAGVAFGLLLGWLGVLIVSSYPPSGRLWR